MKKSELIEQLNKIEGDPYVLQCVNPETYEYGSVHRVEESYSTFIDPNINFDKTYVWDMDYTYDDAGFDSEEEWEKFKADPDHKVIVLWP